MRESKNGCQKPWATVNIKKKSIINLVISARIFYATNISRIAVRQTF